MKKLNVEGFYDTQDIFIMVKRMSEFFVQIKSPLYLFGLLSSCYKIKLDKPYVLLTCINLMLVMF